MDHYNLLRQVSRTFALSIEQLPYILKESITISYLLLRVSDCLEDTDYISVKEKPDLLRLWADVLGGEIRPVELQKRLNHLDGDNDPEIYCAQNASQILDLLRKLPIELQEIIIRNVNQTSLGMARWQEHGPYVEDEEAMDDYMHQVAGLVGYLLTDIFSWYSPIIRKRREELLPLSREYGLALQTVNIIRGMRKDYERGWVFVPETYYQRFGLTRDSLFAYENAGKAVQVVNLLAEKAERHLWKGITYISAFPRFQHRIRLGCMWPLFFAVKTLALSKNNMNVVLNEAKINRSQIKDIILKTNMFGWSNRWLVHYFNELMETQSITQEYNLATN